MSPRTLFLGRLIGQYCILIGLSMITRKQATLESVTTLLHDPSMMFVLGAITLIAGLAMVLMHNIWSGGALVSAFELVISLQNATASMLVSPQKAVSPLKSGRSKRKTSGYVEVPVLKEFVLQYF